ncbi:hypothetical protein ACHHRT_03130 [Desulfurivibrio sp. D14AmB]|uniref:hypothetical protein n=1 Tax=Desulfurivibrio sp. D14AmB TaxID=3374370 RepID=UPI00376EC4D1
MNSPREEIIPQSFFIRIGAWLGLFFILAAAAGQIYLYLQTRASLEFHYSAVLLNLVQLQEELLFKSLLNSLIFFIVPCLLAALLLVIYSHRVAGPMFRVKQYLKGLGGQHGAQTLGFREKDVLHPLARAINEVQRRQQEDLGRISGGLEELEELLRAAVAADDQGPPPESLLAEMEQKCRENDRIMESIKL